MTSPEDIDVALPLTKFGDKERTLQFYADKYLQAFPDVAKFIPPRSYSTPHKIFTAYSSNGLDWRESRKRKASSPTIEKWYNEPICWKRCSTSPELFARRIGPEESG